MEAIIGLVGALIGAYVTAKYASKSERRAQLVAFADLLEGIAECLERMENSLRSDIAPTDAGHSLEEIVDDFAGAIRKAPLDTAWKKKAESVRSELRQHLRNGEILDDIIRGHILNAPPETKEQALHGMAVTSGRLRGQADVLRAQA